MAISLLGQRRRRGGTEPVWVYKRGSRADPFLDRFADCDTLSAYCAALQEVGAKYYPDVRLCLEAKAANLVSAMGRSLRFMMALMNGRARFS